MSVKLLPEALALLERYKDETWETLFPVIHHPNMKRHMKALATLAGIKDNLCYHVSRHTFAVLAILKGMPLETLQKVLGHKSILSTQIYAELINPKVGEDTDRLCMKIGDTYRLVN